MKTIAEIKDLMVGKSVITDLADLLRTNDEEFAESKKNYLAAVEILRKELPSGSSPTLDDYLAACESDVISAVAYAGYLGFRVNLDNFHPGEENAFRQLRLNQWVKQAVRWMPMEKWDRCAFAANEDDLEGRICYGGLDLSSTTDITAFVLVFPPNDEDDKFIILPYFWIPEDNLDLRVRQDHVPYDVCVRQGYLQATEGNVATLKNSSSSWVSGSTSGRSPSTVGVLCRWCRTWKAWALQLSPSVRALRICHRPPKN